MSLVTFKKLLSFAAILLFSCSLQNRFTAVADEYVLIPPQIEDGRQIVKLPAVVENVKIGGNGRFLLFHFKTLQKIGVFDVNSLEIRCFIPTIEDDCVYDAGLAKAVVATTEGSTISRYDLLSGKCELTKSFETEGVSTDLLIGSATNGPAYICSAEKMNQFALRFNGRGLVVDLEQLRFSPLNTNEKVIRGFWGGGQARISANGRTIGQWGSKLSASPIQSFAKVGEQWKLRHSGIRSGPAIPSPDGRILYTPRGAYTRMHRQIGDKDRGGYLIPSVHGDYYLLCRSPNHFSVGPSEKPDVSVYLYLAGNSQAIARIPNLVPAFSRSDRKGREVLTLEKRLLLIPKANLIVELDAKRDSLILHQFKIEDALKKSETNYLMFESIPPQRLKAGDNLNYQLEVFSNNKDVKFSLDSGPEGMSLSDRGNLTWMTSESSPVKSSVLISVSNSAGETAFQSFYIEVSGTTGAVNIAKATIGDDSVFDDAIVPLEKVDMPDGPIPIELPRIVTRSAIAGAGRYYLMYFESLEQIGLFDIQSKRITKYFSVLDTETLIAGGMNHFLVFSPNKGVVSRYNLKTFQCELTKPIPIKGKVQYAAMGSGSFGPCMIRDELRTFEEDTNNYEFIDLKTLEHIKTRWSQQPENSFRHRSSILASTNGNWFSVAGLAPIRFDPSRIDCQDGIPGRLLLPASDGTYFTNGSLIYGRDLTKLVKYNKDLSGEIFAHSVTGNYYLQRVTREGEASIRRGSSSNHLGKVVSADLMKFGEPNPKANVPEIESQIYLIDIGIRGDRFPRVMFVPEAGVVVSLESTNDQLVMRKLDVQN